MRLPAALAAGLMLLSAGCASWPAYGRSRAADAADVLPVSLAWGYGLSASVKATPLFNLGLGLSPVVSGRFGYEDRTFYGVWHEYQTAFPWTLWLDDLGSVPPRPYGANDDRPTGDGVPIMYRWQVMKDGPGGEGYSSAHWEPVLRRWGRSPPVARESGGAFVVPEYRRAINWRDLRLEQGDEEPLNKLGTPEVATLWEATRDGPDLPRAWDLFEADLFLGIVGLRIGVRPLEFGDFLAGIVGFDPAGDDIEETTFNEPRDVPLPAAKQPPAPPPAPAPLAPEPAAPVPLVPEPAGEVAPAEPVQPESAPESAAESVGDQADSR